MISHERRLRLLRTAGGCRLLEQASHRSGLILGGGHRNNHGLGSRGIADLANTPQVNQRVGFREVCGRAPAWYLIRSDLEMRGGPRFALEVAGEIDELTLLETCLAHVIRGS